MSPVEVPFRPVSTRLIRLYGPTAVGPARKGSGSRARTTLRAARFSEPGLPVERVPGEAAAAPGGEARRHGETVGPACRPTRGARLPRPPRGAGQMRGRGCRAGARRRTRVPHRFPQASTAELGLAGPGPLRDGPGLSRPPPWAMRPNGSTREPSWPVCAGLGRPGGPRAGQRAGPGSRKGQEGQERQANRRAGQQTPGRPPDGPGTSTGGQTGGRTGRPARRRTSPAAQRAGHPTAPAAQRAGGPAHRPGRSTSGAEGQPRQAGGPAHLGKPTGGPAPGGPTDAPAGEPAGGSTGRPAHGPGRSTGGPCRVKKGAPLGAPWLRPRRAGGRGR